MTIPTKWLRARWRLSEKGYFFFKNKLGWYEPPHDKTNKMTFAPSEDSDQLAPAQSDQSSLSALHEETLGP